MKKSTTTQQKLLKIFKEDFEGCEWFIISANELMKILNDTVEMYKDKNTSLETIKDAVGRIGIGIGNVEKCLNGVEDCYNKTVEVLSDEIKKLK